MRFAEGMIEEDYVLFSTFTVQFSAWLSDPGLDLAKVGRYGMDSTGVEVSAFRNPSPAALTRVINRKSNNYCEFYITLERIQVTSISLCSAWGEDPTCLSGQ